MRPTRIAVAVAAAGALLVLSACTAASPSPSSTTVNVTLQEWAVVVDSASVPAGTVTFEITNTGPADIHEFVIFKTDLAAGDLPVDENGVVDETAGGIEVIDEVEDVAVGASETLPVNLAAGSYVLVCNIWSEDEQESHYQMGMRTAFTVE